MSAAPAQMTFQPDGQRILNDLRQLARFGSVGKNAVTRLAFTKPDLDARNFVVDLMEEAGLSVSVDAFGNIFGRRAGRQSGPSIMTGSHIEGPPIGGIYDGNLGVIGGIEAVRLMNEMDLETHYPVEVAVIAAEHLDRFGMGCLGSRVLAGKLQISDLHRLADAEGISLWQALEQAGLAPAELASARRTASDVRAFVELHIEQGPVLDKLHQRLGVVTSISGPTRMLITLEGETNHSGGTPMSMRRDALAAAAEVILAVETCAAAEQSNSTVGTVGVVRVSPGSMVAIPGQVTLGVDIRSVDWPSKQRMLQALQAKLATIAGERQVTITSDISVDEKPVPCSPQVIAAVEAAAEAAGVPAWRMPSGGGHDAQHMAAITDSGMIFVPSVRGISHAPEEYTELDDIRLGVAVLAGTLWQLSNAVD
jgi:beta-ureidopropionase / N-carbamoyl-L-amino-acid hydrolase